MELSCTVVSKQSD